MGSSNKINRGNSISSHWRANFICDAQTTLKQSKITKVTKFAHFLMLIFMSRGKKRGVNFGTIVLFVCLSVVWASHMDSALQSEEILFPEFILLLQPICWFFVGKVARKPAFTTHKMCKKSEQQKCWIQQKWIQHAEYTEKMVRYTGNAYLIAENGRSEVGRWFWDWLPLVIEGDFWVNSEKSL